MAAYVKYESFIEYLADKIIDLFGGTDTIKAVIHSDAPIPSTDTTLANLTQVTGTGYTAGGEDTLNTGTRSGGTLTVAGTDIVWTAGAADWVAARYVSIYDDTPTVPADPLIASWDYGANFTLGNGETFTLDFGASIFTMA
jgi:hypothetical protein